MILSLGARPHTPHPALLHKQSGGWATAHMLYSNINVFVGPRKSGGERLTAVTPLPSRCRRCNCSGPVRRRMRRSDLAKLDRGPHGMCLWVWHIIHGGHKLRSRRRHHNVKKQFSLELFFRGHLCTRVAAPCGARGACAVRPTRVWPQPTSHKRPADLRRRCHAGVSPAVHLTLQSCSTLLYASRWRSTCTPSPHF